LKLHFRKPSESQKSRSAAHEVDSTGKEPFKEELVKISLSREEPVVEKEVRVTGAVRVRKTEGIEKETIRESVRREDVAVDESGKTSRPGFNLAP